MEALEGTKTLFTLLPQNLLYGLSWQFKYDISSIRIVTIFLTNKDIMKPKSYQKYNLVKYYSKPYTSHVNFSFFYDKKIILKVNQN